MKTKLFIPVLLATCLGVRLPDAAAQTGRIAHFGHGGGAATLAAAVTGDNFGLPTTRSEMVLDSLVYLNDSLAMRYGRVRSVSFHASESEMQKAPWRLWNGQMQYYSVRYGQQQWQEAVQSLRERDPKVKLVGFDKQLKKRSHQKPSGYIQPFPKRPFQYSYWRSLATVAALGAVGWLLGRESKNV